ncbi:MAG TPA: MlaD family protein [Candidatus Cloacimonadota bacterium]|nr:MlaD family protein [Candidatus Cloacimonadota bacterium]
MSYKIKRAKEIVLVFVALPLLLALVVIVLIAIRQKLFEKKYLFHTSLQNAIGLSDQTPVLYKGFEIGRVSSFYLENDGRIKVEFKVLKRYRDQLVANSVIFRSTNPIINTTTLEYLRDPVSKRLLPDGSTIPSTDFADGKAIVEALGLSGSDPVGGILESVTRISSELAGSTGQKSALLRTIDNIALASDKAEDMLIMVESSLAELNSFAANLNRDNNSNAGAVFRAINNLADLSGQVNDQMGVMKELLTTGKDLLATYSEPDSLVARMIDPSGENLFKPIRATLEGLSANLEASLRLLNSFNASSPEIASLLSGLNDSLADARRTLEALNNNPILKMGMKPSGFEPAYPVDRIGEMPLAP